MKRKGLQIGELYAERPLVQGGMGIGVSLSGLAGAVAAAGGVGTISGVQMGFREADFLKKPLEANLRVLRREVQKAKEIAAGRGIVGINIMVAINNYAETVMEAVKSGVELIVCGAGLPLTLPKLVGEAKIKIAPIVSSGRAAKVIIKSWLQHYNRLPDMVVVEGAEAGGHLGFKPEQLLERSYLPLKTLVQEVRAVLAPLEAERHCSIPIVAGGGISSAAEAAEVLAAGADALQIATPFITTEECDASPAFKDVYVKANAEDLRIVQSPAGLPGRAIFSPLLARLQEGREPVRSCTRCLGSCDPLTTPYCITQALIDAVEGNWDKGLFFSGAGVGELTHIGKVQDVFARFLP